MKVNNINPSYRYDIQSLCLIFFPRESFKENDTSDRELTVTLEKKKAKAVFRQGAAETFAEVSLADFPLDRERAAVKKAAYSALCKATGRSSPWGSLTGIRPALFYEKVKETYGENADRVMKTLFSISDEKLLLCADVLEGRKVAVEKNTSDAASLYISIPFCPSRCSYCSFVSAITGRESHLIPDYVDKLIAEAREVSDRIVKDGKSLRSIYVGGGTPSVLSPKETEKLLSAVEELFLKRFPVEEFTFEAGRPDTITKEKLDVIDAHGVTRISINPQTLNQQVLDAVGRKHTVQQFFDAYGMASAYGFDKNVDLIAGLPLDTEESFFSSLDGIEKLRPECITLHTLYLKRAADFGAYGKAEEISAASDGDRINSMLSYARSRMSESGYRPYYLYRQKNTMGNGENIGYSLKGRECLYNVWMMDDIQQIYGIGAGAVTKYLNEEGVKRDGNKKLPLEYLKD